MLSTYKFYPFNSILFLFYSKPKKNWLNCKWKINLLEQNETQVSLSLTCKISFFYYYRLNIHFVCPPLFLITDFILRGTDDTNLIQVCGEMFCLHRWFFFFSFSLLEGLCCSTSLKSTPKVLYWIQLRGHIWPGHRPLTFFLSKLV